MSAAGVDGDVTGAGDKRARGRVFPVFLTDFAGFCLPRVFFFLFRGLLAGTGGSPLWRYTVASYGPRAIVWYIYFSPAEAGFALNFD